MKIDNETQEKLQELQMAEQNLQNFLLQKQAFQYELNEVEASLEELKKSDDEVYKVIGNVMIKAKKHDVVKDLEEKKKVLELRLKSLDNQEKIISEKLDRLRKELEEKFKK